MRSLGKCIYDFIDHVIFLPHHHPHLIPFNLYLYKFPLKIMRFFNTLLVASALLATSVLAHPGHDTRHEIEERAAFMKNSKRDLGHCAAKIKARGIEARAVQRRAAIAKDLRKKRDLSSSENKQRPFAFTALTVQMPLTFEQETLRLF